MTIFHKQFKLKVLSAAVIAASSFNAYAQNASANDPAVEEVLVTGIRGSLTGAMETKRNASGVVDAISAEDIGKFPDTNLAESLQRITGVSIDRSNNEGNQVTVRGFGPSFNLVTLNGRQMPNSSALDGTPISRSFNFREIAAESVSGVEVYKTGKAQVASGGLGATINLKTAKPFDFSELTAHASVKGVIEPTVERGDDVTPEVSGMISNTFADGKLGLLASFSHAERNFHVDRIGTQNGWSRGYPGQQNPDTSAIDTDRNPTKATWRIPTVDLENADYERSRQNGQLIVQFAPTENLTASLDYTMSRHEEEGAMNRMSFWFDDVQTGKADVNGTIINPAREGDELNFWAWEYAFETENDSFGLNVEWDVNDQLSLTLDAHDSTSHANPGARPAERIANTKNPFGAVDIAADFSGKIPSVSYDDSALNGGAYNKANIVGDLYQERGHELENNIQQIQLHGVWRNADAGALTAINFGLAQTNNSVDVKDIYSANFALSNMDLSALDLSFEAGDIGFEKVPVFSANQFIDLVYDQGLNNPMNYGTNGIEEDTSSVYLSFDIETEFNQMPVKTNIGLRYEETDVESYTISKPVIGFNWVSPLEMSKIYDDTEKPEKLKGNYDNFLPNLDVSLNLRDDLVTRFSYSKTIARTI